MPAQTLDGSHARRREASNWPSAPLTVDLYGQTLLALARSPARQASSRSVASGGVCDTLSPAPFSAVDPTDLVEPASVTNSISSVRTADAPSSQRTAATPTRHRIYVATSPVGTDGLAALAAAGIKQVVVPEANLQSLGHSGPPIGAVALHVVGSVSHRRVMRRGPSSRRRPRGTSDRSAGARRCEPSNCSPTWPRSTSTRPTTRSREAWRSSRPRRGRRSRRFLRRDASGPRVESHRHDRARQPALPDRPAGNLRGAARRRQRLLGRGSLARRARRLETTGASRFGRRFDGPARSSPSFPRSSRPPRQPSTTSTTPCSLAETAGLEPESVRSYLSASLATMRISWARCSACRPAGR